MPATLTRTPEALELDLSGCRGSEFTDVLAKAKEVASRRYDGKRKLWLFPPEAQLAERILLAIQPTADPAIGEWVRESRQQIERELVTPLPADSDNLAIPWAKKHCEWQPDTLNGLKPHQRALVAALPPKAVVADDMGLGKTASAISTIGEWLLAEEEENGPKLVVCPNSVKGVWEREIKQWLGKDEPVHIVNGTTPKAREAQLKLAVAEEGWAIVNYEQLRVEKVKRKTRTGGTKTETKMKQPLFSSTPWLAIVADEAHRIKNRKASQTRGMFRVKAPIMLAATGTPIMNSPDELWSLLHWLWPDEYSSYWRFYEEYVDYTEGYHGREIRGVRNPEGLRFELHGRLYRRTKDEVLDLPEKQRVVIPLTLGKKQRKLYGEAERNLWLEIEKEIQDGDRMAERFVEAVSGGTHIYALPNGAARTVRLRQLLSTPALLGGDEDSVKLDACVESILDNRHKQHVVFSEFVGTCDRLAYRLEVAGLKVGIYTGEVNPARRALLEEEFQASERDVMVGTIGAMKEGITLTASDTVHFIERAWVPGWNEQAEDRLHRIGQKNNVTVYIYEAQGTVDDGRVTPTNRLKERIVKTVLPKDLVKER